MKRLLVLFTVGFFFLTFISFYSPVKAQIADCSREFAEQTNGITQEAYDEQCTPPKLKDLQVLGARIIYFVWIGGLAIWIGYQAMTSGADSTKKEDLKKRGLYWFVGLIIFFASQPIAGTLIKTVVTTESSCYAEINETPAFRFFFSEVCGTCICQTVGGQEVVRGRDSSETCSDLAFRAGFASCVDK